MWCHIVFTLISRAADFAALDDKLCRHWRLISPPLAINFTAIKGKGGGGGSARHSSDKLDPALIPASVELAPLA